MSGPARRTTRSTIRRLQVLGCLTIALGVGGFGGWGSTAHIAGAVIAPGTLVVESNAKKVQHLTGGIVSEILVKNGSEVVAGQPLLRLDDTVTKATLGTIRSQLDLYTAREARLVAERDGATAVAFPKPRDGGPESEAAIAGEERLFQSRRAGLDAQRAQLNERIAQIRQEIDGLGAQQQSKEKEIGYIGDELAGVQQLFDKNLVSIARLKQLQRDQARLQGERGQLIADIARSRGKIAETELQILQLDRDFRTGVLKELRETQAKIAELREREIAANDELAHTTIRAPRAGIVYELAAHTIGGVIGKGETIMQIAPRSDPLVVEAKVAPQDIDQVEAGAAVRVRIDAANRRTTPTLEGEVALVSPDLSHDPANGPKPAQEQPYYLVRVAFAADAISSLGDLQLVPGMPAEVYIRTQDRTPLDFLIKPLREQIARTFRER